MASIIWAIKYVLITRIRPTKELVKALVADWILPGSPAAVSRLNPAIMSWTKKMRPPAAIAKSITREKRSAGRVLASLKIRLFGRGRLIWASGRIVNIIY